MYLNRKGYHFFLLASVQQLHLAELSNNLADFKILHWELLHSIKSTRNTYRNVCYRVYKNKCFSWTPWLRWRDVSLPVTASEMWFCWSEGVCGKAVSGYYHTLYRLLLEWLQFEVLFQTDYHSDHTDEPMASLSSASMNKGLCRLKQPHAKPYLLCPFCPLKKQMCWIYLITIVCELITHLFFGVYFTFL